MEPNNRLSEILTDVGFSEVRPSEGQLKDWGMTYNRFNQLLKNNARIPMTVGEMHTLKTWLQRNFKGKNIYLFESDMPVEMRSRQTKLNV